jgi:hypothetical protein
MRLNHPKNPTIRQYLCQGDNSDMLKPIKTKTARASGGTFAIVTKIFP